MKKRKYKEGDMVRVKVFNECPEHWNYRGRMNHLMGKIVKINKVDDSSSSLPYRIHDEENETEWWMKEEDVEPVSETIVIYRNDREVIAMDKLTGKKATAKCDPWDRFDFHIGAKLAFSRLFDEKEECLNTKIVFTKGDKMFKTGYAYEIIDGKIKIKGHSDFPLGEKIKNIEDLKYYFSGKGRYSNYRLEFIEIKED